MPATSTAPAALATSHAALAVGIGWRQPHYAQLLQQRPALDFLEVHSENFFAAGGAALAVLERGRSHYPVSLHGVGLSLGSAVGLDAWHLDQLAALVARIDPVRVSDHASFARGAFAGSVVHAADLLPLPFTAEALDPLCANVQRVQDRLQRRFMVENLSAYLQWNAEQAMPETEFLNTLARRTGCSLLVDVNNIYVNALNARAAGLCADPLAACRNWLDQIAPAAVAELHLAGHCHVNDAQGAIVIDDHGSRVCAEVWALYRHALSCFGNVPTLIEWDTDIPALDTLLDEAARARAMAEQALEMAA
ncbi:MAG: DUF692 domain-containing protein [Rhodoferax sp.]|nr:DUF692 domain-containing protein [Rhodoferax sp.]